VLVGHARACRWPAPTDLADGCAGVGLRARHALGDGSRVRSLALGGTSGSNNSTNGTKVRRRVDWHPCPVGRFNGCAKSPVWPTMSAPLLHATPSTTPRTDPSMCAPRLRFPGLFAYKFFGPHMGILYGKREHLQRSPLQSPSRYQRFPRSAGKSAPSTTKASRDHRVRQLPCRPRPRGDRSVTSRRQAILSAMREISNL